MMMTLELNILIEAIVKAAVDAATAPLIAEINCLKAQLAYFKRRQFGSISERADADMRQLSLFHNLSSEADLPAPLEVEVELEKIEYTRKKQKGKREEDLASLPTRQIVYELPEDERCCPSCDATMRDAGTMTRREIEIIPATAVVVEHITHSYACNNPMCAGTLPKNPNIEESQDPSGSGNDQGGNQVVVSAVSPTPLFQGSLASPSFVAHIAYQKYSNGMPLYRLEKGFWYDGVSISRQTMSNWVIKCSELYLVSIYARMIYYLLLETVAHSDWTGVQVLNEPGRDATTKSHVWVHRTTGASMLPRENGELGRSIIIYEYTQTKAAYNPEGFFSGADGGVSKGLGNFTGHLHVDGDKAYKAMKQVAKPLDGSKSEIILVGCWAHARRPFENILKPLTKEQKAKHSASTGF